MNQFEAGLEKNIDFYNDENSVHVRTTYNQSLLTEKHQLAAILLHL